jgi:hypothetical protein
MVWRINIKQNKLLTRLIDNTSKRERQLILFNLMRIIVSLIRQHISRNQYRFTKTRKKFGLPLTHQNYIQQNVIGLHSKFPYCNVDVKIKGIERNFRPIVILPRRSKYLTIPTNRESVGKSARQFNNLFKPKGKNVLARRKGKSLEILYALTRQVYQPMQKGMLPDERELLSLAYTKLVNVLSESVNR